MTWWLLGFFPIVGIFWLLLYQRDKQVNEALLLLGDQTREIEVLAANNRRMRELLDDMHLLLRSGGDLRLNPTFIERIEYLQDLNENE